MKKALSLILALVLCLSLCACGANNELKEYAGTYIYEGVFTTLTGFADDPEKLYLNETLTLLADGTGSYTKTAGNSIHSIEKGAVLAFADVTWEISNGYMVVKYSGDYFLTRENNQFKLTSPEPISNISETLTFEIKGNLLFDVTTGKQTFKKA